jgi:hypothetical protein
VFGKGWNFWKNGGGDMLESGGPLKIRYCHAKPNRIGIHFAVFVKKNACGAIQWSTSKNLYNIDTSQDESIKSFKREMIERMKQKQERFNSSPI